MKIGFTTRIISGAAMMLFGANLALAIPAKPTPITYTQPDGSTIEVNLRGDERHHYYTSTDGLVLLRGEDDAFRYAIPADGALVASEMLAANPGNRSSQASAIVRGIDQAQVFKTLESRGATSRRQSPSRVAPEGSLISFPVTGSPRTLVILVEYTDKSFTIDNPLETFQRMMSEEGFNYAGATGSVLDYFKYSSNGKFTPQFDVYGPVKLPRTMSYYGGNDSYGDDKNPHKMAIDACKALDSQIDFTVYDTDKDGKIDNVYVFYAGYGEADGGSANTVWPHSWDVASGAGEYEYFDGKLLDHYATSMELDFSSKKLAGIGTFCHEFGHVLSLPDLYATTYTSAFTPGAYDIMDQGSYNGDSHTPPSYSGYERYCLGWVEPTELDEPENVTLRHISQGGYDDVRIIKTPKANEYFIVENRQQVDWDKHIPGHGMLIWHIDFNSSIWARNVVNNSASHQYVDIEEADGKQNESNRKADTFPGTANKTSFTDTTTPSMKTWSGVSLNKPITDIAEANSIIKFKFMGGTSESDPDIENMTVTAQPATDIHANGFTAHWDAIERAASYLLTLYQHIPGATDINTVAELPNPENDTYTERIVDGYDHLLIGGNLTAYIIVGLEPNTTYAYELTGVDADGKQSRTSERVTVRTALDSGVHSAPGASAAAIMGASGGVNLALPTTMSVSVSDISGRLIYGGELSAGTHTLKLSRGVYIVKAGAKATKIAIF